MSSNDEYLAASGRSLTGDDVRRSIAKLKEPVVYRVCGNFDYHTVHPKAEGWTTCANCFGAVFVTLPPLDEQPETKDAL